MTTTVITGGRNSGKYWAAHAAELLKEFNSEERDMRLMVLCDFFRLPIRGLAEYLGRSMSQVSYYRMGRTPVPDDIKEKLDDLLAGISNRLDRIAPKNSAAGVWIKTAEKLIGEALDA